MGTDPELDRKGGIEMKYKNGAVSVLSPGPFAQLVAIRKCECPDGRQRYAKITGIPDTMWTVPARINYKGKTVSGYVTFTDNGPYFSALHKYRNIFD